ncbi:uncharacterized protein [Primulina eburnea]|uniref:uncharacterized protein isoform X3 n=1 Tax=Primulina eburnea TaxID=1245227 RepID=UPI003C6CBBD3
MAEHYLQKRSEESTETAEEEDMLLNFIKKRKLCSERELLENSVSSAASVACGCCADDDDDSSGGVTGSVVVSPDLECESSDGEISMEINCSRIDHESTPTSETRGDSEQSSLESTPHAACPHRTSASSTAEIEEFFAAAEKYEQKRFAEKYNYDIAKDVPLEGKYEWVPLW